MSADVLFTTKVGDVGASFSFSDCAFVDRNKPLISSRVKSATFYFMLPLLAIAFHFFHSGPCFVDAGADSSGKKVCFKAGLCLVFTVLGIPLTSVVYHFEFPPRHFRRLFTRSHDVVYRDYFSPFGSIMICTYLLMN